MENPLDKEKLIAGDLVGAAGDSGIYGLNNRVAALGHSMVAYGTSDISGAGASFITKGLVTWPRILSNGAWDCDAEDILATNTSYQPTGPLTLAQSKANLI